MVSLTSANAFAVRAAWVIRIAVARIIYRILTIREKALPDTGLFVVSAQKRLHFPIRALCTQKGLHFLSRIVKNVDKPMFL
jgi:hypothetical protein